MTKKIKADVMLLLITVIWGASFPITKMVLVYIPAYAYLALRFILAALVLMLIYSKSLKNITKATLVHGGIVGLFMFGGMALQAVGLYTTTASNSGFITGLNVVMVPVISALLLKKRPDKSSIMGVSVAFTGLFFLSGGLKLDFNFGDFLTFLCAICWAFQIIFIDRFTQTDDASFLAIMQLAFTGLASAGLWLAVDSGKPLVINGTVIWILLFTAILGSALGYGVQTVAQKYTTPTHTALIFTAEPVFAAIFAMVIPNADGITEMPSITKAIGCVMILAGMLVSELKLGQRKQKAGNSVNEENSDLSEIDTASLPQRRRP